MFFCFSSCILTLMFHSGHAKFVFLNYFDVGARVFIRLPLFSMEMYHIFPIYQWTETVFQHSARVWSVSSLLTHLISSHSLVYLIIVMLFLLYIHLITIFIFVAFVLHFLHSIDGSRLKDFAIAFLGDSVALLWPVCTVCVPKQSKKFSSWLKQWHSFFSHFHIRRLRLRNVGVLEQQDDRVWLSSHVEKLSVKLTTVF